MSTPTNELIKFCARALGDVTEKGGVEKIEVFYTVEGEPSQRLDRFILGDADYAASDLAEEINSAAQKDCDSREASNHRYVALAFRADEEQPEFQCAFRLWPALGLNRRMGDNSEPPTEKGVIAQAQRHMENAFRLHMEASAQTIRMLSERNLLLEKSNNELVKQHIEIFKLQQDLLDKKQERELLHAQNVAAAKHKEDLVGLIKVAAPIVLDKIANAGGKLLEGSGENPATDALMNLMGQLSPEEGAALMKWVEQLQPQKAALFIQLYKSLAERHQEKESKKPELLRNN